METEQATSPEPPPRRSRDVTAQNVRIRVIDAGDSEAPPLVLIHDHMTGHLEFDEVLDGFAARFHVIAPDLPGFGGSEKPSPARYSYSVESFAEAVADVLASFGLGRASILGHGLGGAVALTLAAEHPELVQRLVVVDALCYACEPSVRTRIALTPVCGSFFYKQIFGRALFRAYFRSDVFAAEAVFPGARVDAYYDAFNSPPARESALAVLRAMQDTRAVVARTSRIRAPALVLWGREDKLFPYLCGQRLVREIHDAKLEVMSTGHSPHEELPEAFVETVTQFLEGRR